MTLHVIVIQVTKSNGDMTPIIQSCNIKKVLEQIMLYSIVIIYWHYGKHMYFRVG